MTTPRLTIHRLSLFVDGKCVSQFMALARYRRKIGAIGGVSLTHAGKVVADLSMLYVDPTFRRRGVAKALIARCIAQARKSKCKGISLYVSKDNVGAKGLYRGLGFICAYQYDDGGLMMTKQIRRK